MKDVTTTTTTTTTTKASMTAAAATTASASKAAPKDATGGGDNKKKDEVSTAAAPAGTPLVPKLMQPDQLRYRPSWESHFDQHVIVRKVKVKSKDKPLPSSPIDSDPIKIAAFDVDGTLVNWTTPNGMWPSKLEHYELWSSITVIEKLRSLYDNDGYQLLLVSNQGGIQKAHTGKKATTFKSLIDWIASVIDRPIQVVVSTRTIKKCPQTSYHKPTSKLWNVAKRLLYSRGIGSGTPPNIDLAESFFVGDSADPDDDQGGVDFKFAQNVGIKFYTPTEYFGIGDLEKRERQGGGGNGGNSDANLVPPPIHALQTRSSLLGGYLQGPILLILCGVQGSGKSTFCKQVFGDGLGSNNGSTGYFILIGSAP